MIKTISLTFIAIVAFAANSVLCKLALGHELIDPMSFTSIRLISGAITLFALIKFKHQTVHLKSSKNWISSCMLFIYAIAFSYAYITLDTGTGALILFGAVQITIILYNLYTKHQFSFIEWLGIITSIGGFVYLTLPSANSPSLYGFLLMTLSGIAWTVYTIRGKNTTNALVETTTNFVLTIPLILVFIFLNNNFKTTNEGIVLAIIAGSVTSALGYTIWYMALNNLTSIQSGIVQLLVPVIAAIAGMVLLGEILTIQWAIASLLILGGILLVIIKKKTTS